jgi:dihydroneopterin aldolase
VPEALAPYCELSLRDLSLSVHLGCSAEEIGTPQEVRVSIHIEFTEPPSAMLTDQIEGTVCYGELATAVQKLTSGREFQTIEYLGFEIFKMAKTKTDARVTVDVHKVKPPVDGLIGGSRFRCGDLLKVPRAEKPK